MTEIVPADQAGESSHVPAVFYLTICESCGTFGPPDATICRGCGGAGEAQVAHALQQPEIVFDMRSPHP